MGCNEIQEQQKSKAKKENKRNDKKKTIQVAFQKTLKQYTQTNAMDG